MRARSYLLSAIVWLTAVATLAAGVPHSVCICPTRSQECCASADSPSQSNPPPAVVDQAANGGRHSAKPKKPAKHKTCCQCEQSGTEKPESKPHDSPGQESSVQPRDDQPTLSRQPCQRSTLAPEPQIVSKTERQSECTLSCPLASFTDAAVPAVTSALRIWSQDTALPPTLDLSTFLQRLTI
jgi:hypothetical protein